MTIDLSTSTTSHGDALANFEDVLGSSFDDVIIGTSGPNNIEGAEGADEISGLAGTTSSSEASMGSTMVRPTRPTAETGRTNARPRTKSTVKRIHGLRP